MKSDFTDLLAELVRQAEPDLDNRLEAQAEELNKFKCTEPLLGDWVAAHDCEYTLAAFELDDEDFKENFPGMAEFNTHDRKQIIEALEEHFKHCRRCDLKRSYDLEFSSRIESVTRQNKGELLRHLEEAAADESTEGDHREPNLDSGSEAAPATSDAQHEERQPRAKVVGASATNH